MFRRALGRVVVVMTSGSYDTVSTVICSARVALSAGTCPSVTCTVNDDVPWIEGVPAIPPVPPLSDSPVGSAPATTLHEYGSNPPEAPSNAE